MNNSITVQEQRHWFWKTGTIISAVLCAIFFLLFWNITDPFWHSILRLCSFIFFALTVLGYLKLMDGPLNVSLSSSDELLLVTYQKKDEIIQEEEFKRNSIRGIVKTKPDKNRLNSYLVPHSATFKIDFNDSDRDLYLFEFSGRPLLFDPSSQEKIMAYLKELEIDV